MAEEFHDAVHAVDLDEVFHVPSSNPEDVASIIEQINLEHAWGG